MIRYDANSTYGLMDESKNARITNILIVGI